MKIAVITPYHQESYSILERCHKSVIEQDYDNIVHIMIADGERHPGVDKWNKIEHMILGSCHHDAGATPRAIAAISAFSRDFDAVAFLDCDNTYEPDHLSHMLSILGTSLIATATRNICTTTGEVLYIDTIESNGVEFCDTNCLFMKRDVMPLLTNWITTKEYRLWSDRLFWSSIIQNQISKIHSAIPTVNYYSKWAWHYQQAGLTPPANSVWISQDSQGNLIHINHQT